MIINFEEMQFSDTKCDKLPTDKELAELYDKYEHYEDMYQGGESTTVFCEECKYLSNCELAKHEEIDTCKKGESMTDNNYDEENIQDVLEQIKEIREETTKDGNVFTILPKYR